MADRDRLCASMLCMVGGCFGIHEVYLGRLGWFVARYVLAAFLVAVGDLLQTDVPLALYAALSFFEGILLLNKGRPLILQSDAPHLAPVKWSVGKKAMAIFVGCGALFCSIAVLFASIVDLLGIRL